MRRNVSGSTSSLLSAMKTISPITLEGGARSGAEASGGSEPARLCRRSVTRWRATIDGVSQSNSTQTMEMPGAEALRTLRVPATPLTADSIGYVMTRSTSMGARPVASVTMVTRGALTSGSTSTGMSRSPKEPTTTSATAAASTNGRWRSETRRRKSIMRPPSARWGGARGGFERSTSVYVPVADRGAGA